MPKTTTSAPSKPKKLFITVGSTLFPALTSTILSNLILNQLAYLNIGTLTVQYGRAELPTDLSSYLTPIDSLDASGSGTFSLRTDGANEMRVVVMRFTDEFERIIKDSDAVISHAGSGSILSVLRRRPPLPLLVVPNTSLMDNHQTELAEALAEQGYLQISTIERLSEALPLFLETSPSGAVASKVFPELEKTRFRDILDETMGFSTR